MKKAIVSPMKSLWERYRVRDTSTVPETAGEPRGYGIRTLAVARLPRGCASSRYRAYQFVPPLAERGVILRVVSLYPKWLHETRRRSRQNPVLDVLTIVVSALQLLRYSVLVCRYDVCLVLRDVAPFSAAWFIKLWRLLNKRIVFDFDDAVYLTAPRVEEYARLADVVTAGNGYLAKWAGIRNSSTKIVPTVVDLDRYPLKIHEDSVPTVIGWMGSPATVPYLRMVVGALKMLADAHPVELRVIGGHLEEVSGLKTTIIEWSEADEVAELSRFDIGIAPMPDDEHTRGKCGLKVLQYMAAGIPVVASAVGVHPHIINHGENGFLVNTEEEWLLSLLQLVRDSQLRRSVGGQGRKTVEKQYNLSAMSHDIADLYRELCNRKQSGQ